MYDVHNMVQYFVVVGTFTDAMPTYCAATDFPNIYNK